MSYDERSPSYNKVARIGYLSRMERLGTSIRSRALPTETYVGDRLGLCRKKFTWTKDALEALRRYNGDELTDAEIASLFSCDRHTVTRKRKELGLPCRSYGERWRRKIAACAKRQLEKSGLENMGQLRVRAFRERARQLGWPEDLSPREVQILQALIRSGPLTRRQICAAIGLPWLGSRKSLKSRTPGGSYTASLVQRKLVVRIVDGRRVLGRGRGRSLSLYLVPLWVLDAWPFTKIEEGEANERQTT